MKRATCRPTARRVSFLRMTCLERHAAHSSCATSPRVSHRSRASVQGGNATDTISQQSPSRRWCRAGRTSQLINRLERCAFGEISLTMTQLRAIEILLRKSIPDLAAVEIKSEQTRRYVVEVPPLLDRDEWQRKYGRTPPRLQ
jgi:hypothetical protein